MDNSTSFSSSLWLNTTATTTTTTTNNDNNNNNNDENQSPSRETLHNAHKNSSTGTRISRNGHKEHHNDASAATASSSSSSSSSSTSIATTTSTIPSAAAVAHTQYQTTRNNQTAVEEEEEEEGVIPAAAAAARMDVDVANSSPHTNNSVNDSNDSESADWNAFLEKIQIQNPMDHTARTQVDLLEQAQQLFIRAKANLESAFLRYINENIENNDNENNEKEDGTGSGADQQHIPQQQEHSLDGASTASEGRISGPNHRSSRPTMMSNSNDNNNNNNNDSNSISAELSAAVHQVQARREEWMTTQFMQRHEALVHGMMENDDRRSRLHHVMKDVTQHFQNHCHSLMNEIVNPSPCPRNDELHPLSTTIDNSGADSSSTESNEEKEDMNNLYPQSSSIDGQDDDPLVGKTHQNDIVKKENKQLLIQAKSIMENAEAALNAVLEEVSVHLQEDLQNVEALTFEAYQHFGDRLDNQILDIQTIMMRNYERRVDFEVTVREQEAQSQRFFQALMMNIHPTTTTTTNSTNTAAMVTQNFPSGTLKHNSNSFQGTSAKKRRSGPGSVEEDVDVDHHGYSNYGSHFDHQAYAPSCNNDKDNHNNVDDEESTHMAINRTASF